jgi:hypothetical protein
MGWKAQGAYNVVFVWKGFVGMGGSYIAKLSYLRGVVKERKKGLCLYLFAFVPCCIGVWVCPRPPFLKGECVSYTHWMGSFYQAFVCY